MTRTIGKEARKDESGQERVPSVLLNKSLEALRRDRRVGQQQAQELDAQQAESVDLFQAAETAVEKLHKIAFGSSFPRFPAGLDGLDNAVKHAIYNERIRIMAPIRGAEAEFSAQLQQELLTGHRLFARVFVGDVDSDWGLKQAEVIDVSYPDMMKADRDTSMMPEITFEVESLEGEPELIVLRGSEIDEMVDTGVGGEVPRVEFYYV